MQTRFDLRTSVMIFGLVLGLAAGAAPPARADVLTATPHLVREGNLDNNLIGFAVSAAGDVNGDGYSDVILSGEESGGTAWCYHGGPNLDFSSPAWTVSATEPVSFFADRVSAAGDVNGDGYDDVIIGAPVQSHGEDFEGRVYVYLGSPSGLDTTPQIILESNLTGANFGGAVGAAGDVNGDGFDDIIVTAPHYQNGQAFEGRAYVFPGSASGVADTPIWTFESDVAQAFMGRRATGAGDLNGDGFDDIVVSAPSLANGQTNEGRVYMFFGSSTGPSLTPSWIYEPNAVGYAAGIGLGCAGDMNADGYADLVMDIGSNAGGASAVIVFHGGAQGLAAAPDRTFPSLSGAFGDDVFTAGDLNGDGCADLIAGDMSVNNLTGQFTILGGSESLASLPVLAQRTGAQANEQYGASVRAAGDVNGDGYGDVIVGAPRYDNGQTDEGRVMLYLGQPMGPHATNAWQYGAAQLHVLWGQSIAFGDWNGDGFSDAAIGAPEWDLGSTNTGLVIVYYGGEWPITLDHGWSHDGGTSEAKFGWSVANAGDVDNDGDDDLVIGEPHYGTVGSPELGRVHLFRGTPNGLENTASWVVTGDATSGRFGWAVTGAGDVNGDGYADVLVGAPDHELTMELGGGAYLYFGSEDGLSMTHAWSSFGDAPDDAFGFSVAGAGDVNGDGYSDIMVGAPFKESGETDEGFAYVYYGSATGISGSWSDEGNHLGGALGFSVASASDIDGNGYSDVLVGGPFFDQIGGPDCGLVRVYLGSAVGLTGATWQIPGDEAGDGFGLSLAGGDVNNDGHGDVLIGAPFDDAGGSDAGAVYLHYGRADGLDLVPAWSLFYPATQEGRLGMAVAMGGDMTGDGFGDFLAGQPDLNNGAGQVRAFYGGRAGLSHEDNGVLRRARQFRSDGVTPVALLGQSDEETSMLLHAVARSPMGRGAVTVEYQVAPVGSPFTGDPIVADVIDTGAPVPGVGSAVEVSVPATGLDAGTAYHWRIRFRDDSPYFPYTPWFSMPGNTATETDVRTAATLVGVPSAPEASASHLLAVEGPNPFTAGTSLRFLSESGGEAHLMIYDVTGRRVATLVDGEVAQGAQVAPWDTKDDQGQPVSAGVYWARLEQSGKSAVAKLVVRR